MLSPCAATSNRPDLKRLYAVSSADRGQNPEKVIHGILGSKLRTSNSTDIWPGPFSNFVFNRLGSLALQIDRDTLAPERGDSEAYALFDGISGKRYYVAIRRALEEAGGYSFAEPGRSDPSNRQRY